MDVGESVLIVVPGAPKGYGRRRTRIATNKAGASYVQGYTPPATQTESAAIRLFASRAMGGRAPFAEAVELTILACFPIPASWSKKRQRMAADGELRPTGKPDWTNIARFEDALKGIVWRDDALVTDAFVFKRFSDRPRLVLQVRAVNLPGDYDAVPPHFYTAESSA